MLGSLCGHQALLSVLETPLCQHISLSAPIETMYRGDSRVTGAKRAA